LRYILLDPDCIQLIMVRILSFFYCQAALNGLWMFSNVFFSLNKSYISGCYEWKSKNCWLNRRM